MFSNINITECELFMIVNNVFKLNILINGADCISISLPQCLPLSIMIEKMSVYSN